MAAPVGTKIALVVYKIETTPGTAIAMTGSDAVRIPEWASVTPPTDTPGEALDRQLVNPSADYGSDYAPIGRYIQHTLPLEIHHPLAHAAAAEESPIYRASGYTEVLGAGISTYATSAAPSGTTDVASISLGFYEGPSNDGELWLVAGARGQLEETWPNDAPRKAQWSYLGGFTAPTDAAVLSPTFQAGIPVAGAVSRTFSLADGVTTLDDELVVRSFSFKTPFAPVARPDTSGGALTAKGYRLPCHLAPGRLEISMEVEAAELTVLPLETMLAQGPNASLWTLTSVWTDNDGVGAYVCTDTFRGLRLVKIERGAGSPRTEKLTFRGSRVSTNPAHSRVFS